MRIDDTHCLREGGGKRAGQEDRESGSRMIGRMDEGGFSPRNAEAPRSASVQGR